MCMCGGRAGGKRSCTSNRCYKTLCSSSQKYPFAPKMHFFFPVLLPHSSVFKREKTNSAGARFQFIIYKGNWGGEGSAICEGGGGGIILKGGEYCASNGKRGALDGQIIRTEQQEYISFPFLIRQEHLSCFIVAKYIYAQCFQREGMIIKRNFKQLFPRPQNLKSLFNSDVFVLQKWRETR